MDKPKQHTVEERIKILEACQKRWQECGETECAAIYQGAVFELKLYQERIDQLEGFKVVLNGICDIVYEFPNHTNENVSVAVQRIKDERDRLKASIAPVKVALEKAEKALKGAVQCMEEWQDYDEVKPLTDALTAIKEVVL